MPAIVDESGAPCSDATSVEACEDALAALPTEGGFPGSDFFEAVRRQLVYTRGDEVGIVRTKGSSSSRA